MKHLLVLLIPLFSFAGQPCKGTTAKGSCKSIMVMKSGYCKAHDPNTKKCGAKTAKGTPCKNSTNCRFHKK